MGSLVSNKSSWAAFRRIINPVGAWQPLAPATGHGFKTNVNAAMPEPSTFVLLGLASAYFGVAAVRKIDRVLDTGFVRELTAACYPDGLGRPSIDSEVYFRRELVTYLYGIASARQLCEDVYYNLAYRWFCRLSLTDVVPDHSSRTRIRDRLGEEAGLARTLGGLGWRGR